MKHFFWILIVFIVVLSSCKKQNDPDIILNIEEEFAVILWEQLEQNSRGFNLNLLTLKKNFKCQNYTIRFDQSQTGNKLFVSINDIIEPVACSSGEGSAYGLVDFKSLNDGIYSLTIDLKDEVSNKGFLEVTADYYRLNMNSKDGIVIRENQLNRVPDGLIWGFIQHKEQSIKDAFLEELDLITEQVTLEEGNYGYFKLDTQLITINTEIALANPITFAYSLSGSSVELKNIAKKYQEEYGNGLTLKIYTYQGEEF